MAKQPDISDPVLPAAETGSSGAEDGPTLGAELILLGHDLADLFGRYCRRYELTLPQAQLLDLLARRAPVPLEPWQIAQVLNVGSSNVTMTLDRMAASGHVERVPHPDDRRRRLVHITPDGLAVNAKITAGLAEIEARIMDAALPPEGQAQIAALAADIRHALREMVIPERRSRPGP